MLDHHHRVSAGWNGGASHDLDGFAGSDRQVVAVTGLHLPDNPQLSGSVLLEIGNAKGISIACGPGKRREVAVSGDRLGEHPSQGLQQREFFSLLWPIE